MLQHVTLRSADPWLLNEGAAATSISIGAMRRKVINVEDEQAEVGSSGLGECVLGGSTSPIRAAPCSSQQQQQPDDGDKLPSWSSNSSSMEEEDAEMIAVQSLLALDVGRIRRTGAVFVHGGVPIVQKRVQRRARSSLASSHQHLGCEELPDRGPLTRRASKRRQENAAVGSSPPMAAAAAKQATDGPVRSKRGRAQLMPSKFHDSVLVQWKKKRTR